MICMIRAMYQENRDKLDYSHSLGNTEPGETFTEPQLNGMLRRMLISFYKEMRDKYSPEMADRIAQELYSDRIYRYIKAFEVPDQNGAPYDVLRSWTEVNEV